MQSTLQKFIDPANIPKKYGGELDFEFGQMPVLDPALKELIAWEDSYTDFPHGPLFWHDRGEYIELEAVGSVNMRERREMVCKLSKVVPDQVYSEKLDGRVLTEVLSQRKELRPSLLRMPTEKEGYPLVIAPDAALDKKVEAPAAPPSEATKSEFTVVKAEESVSVLRPGTGPFVMEDTLNGLIENNKIPSENVLEVNGVSSESPDVVTPDLEIKLKDSHVSADSTHQHGEPLYKITTGKHSVDSRRSLESGRRSNRSTHSLKRILEKLKG